MNQFGSSYLPAATLLHAMPPRSYEPSVLFVPSGPFRPFEAARATRQISGGLAGDSVGDPRPGPEDWEED